MLSYTLSLSSNIRIRTSRTVELARVDVTEASEVGGDSGFLVRGSAEEVGEPSGGEGCRGFWDAACGTDGGHAMSSVLDVYDIS